MRLCCLIPLKISGLYGLNVVTYGMMSDSFDYSGFFNIHVLSSNFTFSMASSLLLMDIFVYELVDLNLSISNGTVFTKIYDKLDLWI